VNIGNNENTVKWSIDGEILFFIPVPFSIKGWIGLLQNTLKAIKCLTGGGKGTVYTRQILNGRWARLRVGMCSPPPSLLLSLDTNSTYGLKATRQYYTHQLNRARRPFISFLVPNPTIHMLNGIISCRIVGETREICAVFDAIPIVIYTQYVLYIHWCL